AEDGIRDRNVTGVQTCALPISPQRFDMADQIGKLDYCILNSFSLRFLICPNCLFYLRELLHHILYCFVVYRSCFKHFLQEIFCRSEERRVGKEWSAGWWSQEQV